MATHVVSREAESREIAEFLATARSGPSALVVDGEAGVGKTTVWLAALEQAQGLGFRVLSTRATSAESVLAYSSLAGLLEGLDDDVFAMLPPPQRVAIDRVLLRVNADGPVTDQRAVTAALLSVVERLAEVCPVLVGIDDLQWLDLTSAHIVSSVVRRLGGSVGVLATVRTGADSGERGVSLELREPGRVRRLRVRPLSVGALHATLSERLGRSFSRPKMLQIHEVSGGNPFYALELARAMNDESRRAGTLLPSTLAELVRARIGSLPADARHLLLAAACLPDPSVELIASAVHTDPESVVAILDAAESQGIIEIDGQYVNFTHPLLIRGVYTDAAPAQRRAMHRRLAEIIEEPELKARHLALAATSGDHLTLDSLDTAAELARVRGAPTAAAELIELAIGLGGDTPQRQIKLAGHRFNSGDGGSARVLLEDIVAGPVKGGLLAEALSLLAVISQLEGSLLDAADFLERAIGDAGDDLELRVWILVSLAWVQIHIGHFDESAKSIDDAVTVATQLGQNRLLSQAFGMQVVVHVLLGNGLDDQTLCRAIELEEGNPASTVMFRPEVHSALVLAWTGQLGAAHDEFLSIRRGCIERGEESELVFVSFHTVLNEIWRADFTNAALIAEDTVERALQLDGELPVAAALTVRALVAAYAGHEDDARRDTSEAIEPIQRCGSKLLTAWTVTTLGFLEVSLGNYEAAVTALRSLVGALDAAPNSTEIFVAPFLPDAIEAMIGVGRLDDAEPLIERLERNGERLDRPWMLACGGRCRGMLLAARGDLEGAGAAALRAMAEHDRLPMPFERARTQLLVGQLQRRQKQREVASGTLGDALAIFESLGTTLWADRARAELDRASGVRAHAELTASERRVAELAASGVTNREMAAALFISPKTVEANLSRVYRKLNIRSRAQLGRIIGRTGV